MNYIFKLSKNIYNLKNDHLFESQNSRTKRYGLGRIAYRASQIWKIFLIETREKTAVTNPTFTT